MITEFTFKALFEERVNDLRYYPAPPVIVERLGVMSIDSLERQWDPISLSNVDGDVVLIALAKDKQKALIGRPGIRDDGKFCVEIMARATVENGKISHCEWWYLPIEDQPRRGRQLWDAIQDHLN